MDRKYLIENRCASSAARRALYWIAVPQAARRACRTARKENVAVEQESHLGAWAGVTSTRAFSGKKTRRMR